MPTVLLAIERLAFYHIITVLAKLVTHLHIYYTLYLHFLMNQPPVSQYRGHK